MKRTGFWLLAATFAAACGTSEDDRPQTAAYIATAILKPGGAAIGCHSSSAKASGYSFDTPAEAPAALCQLVSPGDTGSFLLEVLTRSDFRMPADAPMANADIALIEAWIVNNSPGISAAECAP